MHGEIGQTQFLPKSILNYGTGGNLDNAANALTSTANFLKGHGWRAGAGYQPGEANFGAIQAWNAAPVYQRAIALIGRQIDGGEGAVCEALKVAFRNPTGGALLHPRTTRVSRFNEHYMNSAAILSRLHLPR